MFTLSRLSCSLLDIFWDFSDSGSWATLTGFLRGTRHSRPLRDVICLSTSSQRLVSVPTQRRSDGQTDRNTVMWPIWPSVLCSLDELCLIVPSRCSGPQDNQRGLIVPHSLLRSRSDLTPLTSHSHYFRLLLIYLINSCLASPPQKSIMAGRFTRLLHQVMSMSYGVSRCVCGRLNTGCNTQRCALFAQRTHGRRLQTVNKLVRSSTRVRLLFFWSVRRWLRDHTRPVAPSVPSAKLSSLPVEDYETGFKIESSSSPGL